MAAHLRSTLAHALKRVVTVLDHLAARYAVVGGVAVSVRARERFTRDLDLAVAAADDTQAEAIVHAMTAAGFRIEVTIEQVRTGRMATVRLTPPGAPRTFVDLLFASSGIEDRVAQNASDVSFGRSLIVPVASVGHLVALKVLSADPQNRPTDIDDINALLDVASTADLRTARASLRRIRHLRCHRNKDLLQDFERLVAAHAKRPTSEYDERFFKLREPRGGGKARPRARRQKRR